MRRHPRNPHSAPEWRSSRNPSQYRSPRLYRNPSPVPEPEPVSELEPAPEPEPFADLDTESPVPEEIVLSAEPEEGSLEFDASATDVSDIFIAPSQAEHDTGSGSYEAVVLGDEPPSDAGAVPAGEIAPELDEPSHADTIAADDWSLLDDDEPPADAESIIEESPLFQEPEPEPEPETVPEPEADSTSEISANDPAWIQQMFAEAEADAARTRTAERQILHPVEDEDADEPAVVKAARDLEGVSVTSGDTALEPLLNTRAPRYPTWVYASGIGLLALLMFLQVIHYNRHGLVLSNTVGPLVSSVYGWFGATLTPRWDLSAYSVKQLGAEAEGSEGSRLRVRLSVQNDSDRVQPLPLLRLTLQDRFGTAVATRDLEPAEYLPQRAAGQRLLEPDQRIDAELQVIDPGKAAIGFEIDACLRSEDGHVGCANEARRRAPG